MPIADLISKSESPMDAFLNRLDQGEKNRLMAAQAGEASAKGNQAQMMANLFGVAFGAEPPSNGNQSSPESSNMMPPAARGSNQLPMQQNGMGASSQPPGQPSNRQQQARDMLERLGYLVPTSQEKAALEQKTAYNKELGSSDVKTMGKWDDTITASHEMSPVLNNIQEISANPTFQNMYKNPEYLGKDIDWLSRFGTPEEQKLIGDFTTNQKSIFSSMGQDFKGAFREFELNIFNKASPDIHDTLPQIQAKTNTLLALKGLVSKRLSLAQDIVRSSQGQISPSAALEIADKQINAKEVRKQIDDQFKASEREQKEAQKQQNSQKGNTSIAPKGAEVEIYDPQGNLIGHGSKVNAAKFLLDKKHRGYYQKVIGNG